MKNPFLIGKKLYLRSLEEEDITGEYFDWLNDYEVTKFMYTTSFPNSKEKMLSFLNSTKNDEKNIVFAIIDKKSDKHIGNIRLGPINWVHRRSDFGIMIGNKRYWGKNYGFEATKLLLKYAFDRLNLYKILLGVVENQKSAIGLYQRLGFEIEGKGIEQFYCEGKYLNCIYMGLRKKNFEKLMLQ